MKVIVVTKLPHIHYKHDQEPVSNPSGGNYIMPHHEPRPPHSLRPGIRDSQKSKEVQAGTSRTLSFLSQTFASPLSVRLGLLEFIAAQWASEAPSPSPGPEVCLALLPREHSSWMTSWR